ncbi:nucleotidyltransferase domain-containing protein [Flavobacterium sp. DSP2-3-1]|uniref:nucleotidyltransferase domain-containing protein n=1 Tax=Flavobacterium sp. DSP2-3-1 TaxID=2804620 RepID=UPI003CED7C9D
MAKNYRQLIESVKGRINPEHFALKKTFSDELSTISYSEVLTYIRLSMKGVEPEYTQKSKDAGERVKEHLLKELNNVSFKYQGSVMTDTHIKGYSDVDLLTICEKFYQPDNYNIKKLLENSEQRVKFFSSLPKLEKEVTGTTYQGNELDDLRNLRIDSENILSKVYSNCDKSKPKSIKIKNLSLNREVDVVIANWYDDVTSVINDKGDYRGIQVYNKDTNSRGNADYPFLSIKRINERSSITNGRLKKMIRFLKNTKANSEQNIDLSSFDINAICYDISVYEYQTLSFYELVPIIYNQMKNIATDDNKADNLVSVDGREYIFRGNTSKKENLKKLLAEVEGVFQDLKNILRL